MPELYGSEVREQEKVDGFASGLKAAGKVSLRSMGIRYLWCS